MSNNYNNLYNNEEFNGLVNKHLKVEEFNKMMEKESPMNIFIGYDDRGNPVYEDILPNTSAVIVGQSGIGKSTLMATMLFNLMLKNSTEDLNIHIHAPDRGYHLDGLSNFPHVKGYTRDFSQLKETLDDVYSEILRRKDYFNRIDYEGNYKDYDSYCKEVEVETGEKLDKLPYIVVCIDDFHSSTIGDYYLSDDELKDDKIKEVKNIVSKLTQLGRTVGVFLIVSGSKSIDTFIPKNVMANSSIKIGMAVPDDKHGENLNYEIMRLDKSREILGTPNNKGECLMKSFNYRFYPMIQTSSLVKDFPRNNEIVYEEFSALLNELNNK